MLSSNSCKVNQQALQQQAALDTQKSMQQAVLNPLYLLGDYLGCVGRGAGLGALGGTAKAGATWFFGPPGWAANIVGGAAAGGAVGAVVCAGY
jgi:hypothetical protein